MDKNDVPIRRNIKDLNEHIRKIKMDAWNIHFHTNVCHYCLWGVEGHTREQILDGIKPTSKPYSRNTSNDNYDTGRSSDNRGWLIFLIFMAPMILAECSR